MEINSAEVIYFSPTGTTKKIVNAIVKGIGTVNNNFIDITSVQKRNMVMEEVEADIVIIGVPVYEERIPKMVQPFLTSLKGNGKPVVLVAVYGNIGEGIALNELTSITSASNFKIVAAGSFIGEHSFSTKEVPIQEGRPSCEDLNEAEEFGQRIMIKLRNIENLNNTSVEIPQGSLPLMAKILPENSARIFTKIPVVDMNICSSCGACVKLCPMGAIDKDSYDINNKNCIRCFSCVKRCPKKARKIIYRPNFIVSRMLKSKNTYDKPIRIYL